MPAAVHDLVDGVRRQLGPVEPVALGDLHDHLRVVVQVIGLLPQAEHFPHQDPCTMGRAAADRGERASVKRYSLPNELHTPGQEGSGSEPGSLGDESKHEGRGRDGGPEPSLPEPRLSSPCSLRPGRPFSPGNGEPARAAAGGAPWGQGPWAASDRRLRPGPALRSDGWKSSPFPSDLATVSLHHQITFRWKFKIKSWATFFSIATVF